MARSVTVKSFDTASCPCAACPFTEDCSEGAACRDFTVWVATGVAPSTDRRRWRGLHHALYNPWGGLERAMYRDGLSRGRHGQICRSNNRVFMLGVMDGWDNIEASQQELEHLNSALIGLNRLWLDTHAKSEENNSREGTSGI